MSIDGGVANQPPEWITPAGSLLTVEERKFGTVDVKATDPVSKTFCDEIGFLRILPSLGKQRTLLCASEISETSDWI